LVSYQIIEVDGSVRPDKKSSAVRFDLEAEILSRQTDGDQLLRADRIDNPDLVSVFGKNNDFVLVGNCNRRNDFVDVGVARAEVVDVDDPQFIPEGFHDPLLVVASRPPREFIRRNLKTKRLNMEVDFKQSRT
jgi:hypothetical protein